MTKILHIPPPFFLLHSPPLSFITAKLTNRNILDSNPNPETFYLDLINLLKGIILFNIKLISVNRMQKEGKEKEENQDRGKA